MIYTVSGPLVLVCIFLSAIIRGAASWETAIAGVGGMLLCYCFRLPGLIAAACFLAILFAKQFTAGQDLLWNALFALGIAFSLLLTTLCAYEQGDVTEFETVRVQLSSLQSKFESSCTEQQKIEEQKIALDRQLAHVQTEYLAATEKLAKLENANDHTEKQLKEQIAHQKHQESEQQRQNEQLVHECMLMQEKLDALKKQHGAAFEEKKQLQHDLSKEFQEKRRFEGLYLQLREQYKEQLTALETVRHELLHGRENFTNAQSELEKARTLIQQFHTESAADRHESAALRIISAIERAI